MGKHRIFCWTVNTWSKYLSWVFIVAHTVLLCEESIEGYMLWEDRPSNGKSTETDSTWNTRVLFLSLRMIENVLELFMSIVLLLGAMMGTRRYLKSWVIFASLIIFWHIILTIIRESILGDIITEVMANFAELIFIVSLYGFVMWVVGILIHEITVENRRLRASLEVKQRSSLKAVTKV